MKYYLLVFWALLGLGTAVAEQPALAPSGSLRIRLEVWEVPTTAWARETDTLDASGALDAWRKRQFTTEHRRLVHAPVIVVRRGAVASIDSLKELIYPTEFIPTGLSAPVPEQAPAPPAAPETLTEVLKNWLSSAAYRNFETRNSGLTLQATAAPVHQADDLCDVSLQFEKVELLSFERFGPNALSFAQPHFTCYRTGAMMRVATGRWQLVSAQQSPPDLDGDAGDMSWIAIVRVDPAR